MQLGMLNMSETTKCTIAPLTHLRRGAAAAVIGLLGAACVQGQTSSLLLTAPPAEPLDAELSAHDPAVAIHGLSIYTIPIEMPKQWQKHDLVEIVVRESSAVESSQEISTEKSYDLNAEIANFPQLTVNDLIQGVLKASQNKMPPKADVGSSKEFSGEAEVGRQDSFTARVTGEVIDILPNGNLVLEARTSIRMDRETATILLGGVCDPKNISPAGQIYSSQLFNLHLTKLHEGELKKATEKGLFSRVLDTMFAF